MTGKIQPGEAFVVGLALSALGVGVATGMDPLYGLIIFAGLFFDVVIYTIWLKRRTCWSIVWGGISGAMPILAGRTLAVGYIDLIGIRLALSVLFWIPTHTRPSRSSSAKITPMQAYLLFHPHMANHLHVPLLRSHPCWLRSRLGMQAY